MSMIARRVAPLLLTAVLLGSSAIAGEPTEKGPQGNRTDGLLVGQGIVCDTAKQVERFTTLIEKARDDEHAMNIVNEEASNPVACAKVLAAFVRGEEVANVRNAKGLVAIVEITIIAVPVGDQWQFIAPLKQYAAFPTKGINI